MDNQFSSFIRIQMPETVFEDKNQALRSFLGQLFLSAPQNFVKLDVDIVRGYNMEGSLPVADMIQIKIKYQIENGDVVQALPTPEVTKVLNFIVDGMQTEAKQGMIAQGKGEEEAAKLSTIKHLVITLDKEKHFSIGDIEYLSNPS